MKTMKLIDFLAKACHFAQVHVYGPDAETIEIATRESMFGSTSAQVAYFLDENTVHGHKGVDFEVVYYELTELPMASAKKWKAILNAKAKELGGWKR